MGFDGRSSSRFKRVDLERISLGNHFAMFELFVCGDTSNPNADYFVKLVFENYIVDERPLGKPGSLAAARKIFGGMTDLLASEDFHLEYTHPDMRIYSPYRLNKPLPVRSFKRVG